MTNKALIIQDLQSQPLVGDEFLTARNLIADYYYNTNDALNAIRSCRYRCIFISMDMQKENPIEIIRALRLTESKSGLPPSQILIAGTTHQLTHVEKTKFNICAQIWTHRMS